MLISSVVLGQTMIEMADPNDADMVFIQVRDTADADVIIYCTEEELEFETWDCMWKIKSWGFSNFSFYLAQDENDSLLYNDEGQKLLINGKIMFTKDKEIRGYKNDKAYLNGIMKVNRNK